MLSHDENETYSPMHMLAFVASWCPYSLLIDPAAKKAAGQIGCSVRFVDVDEEPDTTLDCHVTAVPTVLLAFEGEFIGRWEGQTNPEDIPEFFTNVYLARALSKANLS